MKNPREKIFSSADEFSPIMEQIRNTGRKIVFTNGCFDIIHRGHCEYLFLARQSGDFLVVGLNTDESVRRLKGADRPYNSFFDRAFVLASMFFVDAVIAFPEDTPLQLITAIKPDVLVKGADYQISEIVGAKQVLEWGGKVERIPLVKGKSTTLLIQKILNSKGK